MLTSEKRIKLGRKELTVLRLVILANVQAICSGGAWWVRIDLGWPKRRSSVVHRHRNDILSQCDFFEIERIDSDVQPQLLSTADRIIMFRDIELS
jgi:hypothetical protein